VLIAHPRGLRTTHVQCTVRRDRTSMQGKLYPTYELILEEPRQTIIIARKMNMNLTSNYHLFDMTRGMAGKTLSKKAGNYLGKLRARNSERTEYVLLNCGSDKEELAGIIFDRLSVFDQVKEGNQPRKLKVLLPPVNDSLLCIPNQSLQGGMHNAGNSLCDVLVDALEKVIHVPLDHTFCTTKDPVYENGNYRLNFNGRVSLPSVKNFQIVSPNAIDNVLCQFGKVEEDVFHLDYKFPFNAVQAMSLALCQFNL
jgi:tubby-related protein 1